MQPEGNTINKSRDGGVAQTGGVQEHRHYSDKSFFFSICHRQINSDDNDWYTNQYSPGEMLPISIF